MRPLWMKKPTCPASLIKSIEYDETTRQFVFSPWEKEHFRYMEEIGARRRNSRYWLPELFWRRLEFDQPLPDEHPYEVFKRRTSPKSSPGSVPRLLESANRLRTFQGDNADAMITGPMLLADDTGLGKTVSTGAAYAWRRQTGKVNGMFVVGPNPYEWQRILGEHFKIPVTIIDDPKTKWPKDGVVCISYAKIWRPNYYKKMVAFLADGKKALVADEAHRIAGWTSQQFQAMQDAALFCHYRWALTATEVSNQPDSYYPIYTFVTRANLDRTAYLTHMQGRDTRWDSQALEDLAFLRKSFAMGKKKTDPDIVKELPPLTEQVIPVPCDQARVIKLNAIKNDENLLGFAKMQAAFRICTSLENNPKMGVLEDLIDRHSNEKIIVWSFWPKTLDKLYEKFILLKDKDRCAVVHGGIDARERDHTRGKFQMGGIDILFASPLVFGEAVTLTTGSVSVTWDVTYRRVPWVQAKGRLYRIGANMRRPVFLYNLVLHPFETRILEWMNQKGKWADQITDDLKDFKDTSEFLQ